MKNPTQSALVVDTEINKLIDIEIATIYNNSFRQKYIVFIVHLVISTLSL